MKQTLVAMYLMALGPLGATPGYAQKAGRTYYDEAMMSRVREKIETQDWARREAEAARRACEWLVSMGDQELWDFVPPPEQVRAINVCIAHDCPICGDEVNRKAGHYPWIMDRGKPFKVKCPVCETVFPSNDFQPWNTGGLDGPPETGPGYVDKGLGWQDTDGRRYYFVPYYIFWQRWVRDVLGGISELSKAYLLTGEQVYAHKCAVMLCKVASEYGRLDYAKQAYHEGIKGVQGRISDHIWSTGDDSKLALAYDAVWPGLVGDPELAAFLEGNGIDDPRGLIEQEMLHLMVKDVMTGFVAGNMGMHQITLCNLAIVLANNDSERGPTTAELREWLMSGGGRVEDLLWNGFWREGLGGESAPGYASGWCVSFYEVAELLPKLGVDIWSNPKLKKMADIGLDLTVAGEFTPSIGDCGSLSGTRRVAWSSALQGPAFSHYGDPRHAAALALLKAPSRSLFEDYYNEQAVAEAVARHGTEVSLGTRALGGYGLAILEAGEGDSRRGLSLYYGDANGGHGHYDRLNIEMFAFGRPVMPDDGYPTPFTRPDFHEWRRADTHKHYCVMVDEQPQHNLNRGQINTVASAPGLQLADASAEAVYSGVVSMYRRTSALVDMDKERSYLLDVFRVRGGQQHDWCFHGPAFPQFSMGGGALSEPQTKGTLAGEDVPYGTRPPVRAGRGTVFVDLLSADGLLPGEYAEPSKEGWAVFGRCILTRAQGAAVSFRTPQPVPAGKVKALLQIYDYNKGENVVDLALGGVNGTLQCEPSGAVGYRWTGQEFDLPEPTSEVSMTATLPGQEFVQINGLCITTNLSLREPGVTLASSGFQGLYNVRRMNPAGMWSATWLKPDEDLGVTLTVPGGCVGEVIVADGEPEAQPGNPKAIQYVLGRNLLPEQAPVPPGLWSSYVAVVEPHSGPARVTGVELVRGQSNPPEAVGVAVRRGDVVDLVHSSCDPHAACTWSYQGTDYRVAGEYAVVTVDGSEVSRVCLVNGAELSFGDLEVKPEPQEPAGVAQVDFARNTITLDAPVGGIETYVGATAVISNDLRRTGFVIQSATGESGAAVLGFGDVLPIVGMFEAAETDQAAGVVVSDRPLSGYGRTDAGRHEGRWLYNDDKSRCFRIQSVRGQNVVLEGVDGDLAAVYADVNGDGRRQCWISDIGPGDEVRLPNVTFLSRTPTGELTPR